MVAIGVGTGRYITTIQQEVNECSDIRNAQTSISIYITDTATGQISRITLAMVDVGISGIYVIFIIGCSHATHEFIATREHTI